MSIFSNISGFIQLFKPVPSILAGIVGCYCAVCGERELGEAFRIAIITTITAMYGFGLNNIIDVEKDRLQGKKSLLIDENISPVIVLIVTLSLSIISIFLSFSLELIACCLVFLLVFLLSIYSFVNNRVGVIANFIVALCSSIIIILAFGNNLTINVRLLVTCTFFLIFGREIMKDLYDVKGDKQYGKSSIPVTYGKNRSFTIIIISFILLSLLMARLHLNFEFTFWVMLSYLMFLLLLWPPTIYYIINQDKKAANYFVWSTRILYLMTIPILANT